MHIIYKSLNNWFWCLLLGLILPLQSCIYDEVTETSDPDGYYLTVKVQTKSIAGTRASHEDDAEERGSEAEDYMDIEAGDIKLSLFDKAGNYLFDIVNEEDWEVIVDSKNMVYHVFEKLLEFPDEMPQDQVDRISREGVKVLVVTNWKSNETNADYDGAFKKTSTDYQNLTEIWADDGSYNFSYEADPGNMSWTPDIQRKRLIPMFGIAQSTPFTEYANGKPMAIATIPMQRVLAKVEVIDGMQQEGVAIESVQLTDYNTSGRLIPDVDRNPDWDKTMAQVDVSSIPAGVREETSDLNFVKEEGKKWVAYVPEKELIKVKPGEEVPADRTHIDVKIGVNGTLEEYYDGGVFPIHFARYDQTDFTPYVPDESWNHILRNHIYRYTVTKLGMGLELHLHVIPWYVDEYEEWDFTDNISLKPLVWEGNYQDFDEESGEVRLSLGNDELLTGVFQIMSPVNGNWYAKLVPLGDADPSSVSFVDSKGNVIPSENGNTEYNLEIHGKIPGPAESAIFIRPTRYGDAPESRFRLEFYVENLDTWVEVPMVKEGTASNFIIIRPSNIIQ